jgi:hypothetical protein
MFLKLLGICFAVMGPLILQLDLNVIFVPIFNFFKNLFQSGLIEFTKDKRLNVRVGLLLAVLLLIKSFMQTLVFSFYLHYINIIGARLRNSLTCLIYNKVRFLLVKYKYA